VRLIAMLQFIRAVGGWQIMVNGTLAVPVRASWIACIIAAARLDRFPHHVDNAKPCC